MKKVINVGDLVVSTKGRDKGETFLITEVNGDYAFIVNGRIRKVQKPKKKKCKHLKKVLNACLNDLADKIRKGSSVGNLRVYRAIKAEKEKIQED